MNTTDTLYSWTGCWTRHVVDDVAVDRRFTTGERVTTRCGLRVTQRARQRLRITDACDVNHPHACQQCHGQ